jgi:hypothetical protein
MSPLAQKYLEDEPQAAALLLELTQFRRGASDEPVEGIAERRVVLQAGAPVEAAAADARRAAAGADPDGVWASTAVVLLSTERDAELERIR